jgi:Family of unknown function (DUF5683)
MKTFLSCFFILTVLFIFSSASVAQQEKTNNIKLTGSLSTDSKLIANNFQLKENPDIQFDVSSKRSPWLASLFSIVLPGAGEAYAESYWKAGIFVAIEGALISTAIIYNNKGNTQTQQFQNYADAYQNPDHNWSVVRYAQWLIDYHDADPAIITNTNESLPPWQRVNWVLLNQYEIGSHQLPPHGEQQYYEEIGKYNEYSPGWNDYNRADNWDLPAEGNMLKYADMRGHANDLYNVSTKAVAGIYINHFLSALDAYWSTTIYNKEVAMRMRVDTKNYAYNVELVPTLSVQVSF